MGESRPQQQQELEAKLRKSLEDLVEIADKLKPLCNGIDDLVEMATLALTNDGQLRLLLREVVSQTRK